jgi:hypothetical protein
MADFRDHNRTQIGTVVEVLRGHQTYIYGIFSVDGFGVACPGMLTSNGSAYRLALYLSALVEGRDRLAKDFNGYQINVTVGGRQYQYFDELHAALKVAHDQAQLRNEIFSRSSHSYF